jgi:hypothetical protein
MVMNTLLKIYTRYGVAVNEFKFRILNPVLESGAMYRDSHDVIISKFKQGEIR